MHKEATPPKLDLNLSFYRRNIKTGQGKISIFFKFRRSFIRQFIKKNFRIINFYKYYIFLF